jgi:hypothetical protein
MNQKFKTFMLQPEYIYVAHSIVRHTQMLELGSKLYLGVIVMNPILKNTQSSENVWQWIN